jgi:hypothetical protein
MLRAIPALPLPTRAEVDVEKPARPNATAMRPPTHNIGESGCQGFAALLAAVLGVGNELVSVTVGLEAMGPLDATPYADAGQLSVLLRASTGAVIVGGLRLRCCAGEVQGLGDVLERRAGQ